MPRDDPGDEPIRYAVVCAPADESGPWLAHELRGRGIPARVVTIEELVYSTSLTHEVRLAGTSARVRLADGNVFGPDLVGTVNRVTVLPTDHLRGTAAPDRAYATQELQATLLSLLGGLPGAVLGRPDPRGLSGAWWRPAEWMIRAGQAGLTGAGYRRVVSGAVDEPWSTALVQVLVVGREVICDLPVPADVAAGCHRLAVAHGGGLLGVDFVVDGPDVSRWRCAGGTPLPDLRRGGDRVVSAVLAVIASSFTVRERVSA